MRLTKTLAALTCLALPVQALDLNEMSPEERQIFQQEVRTYLLENPEVIMEAVQVLEARQQQQQELADLSLVTDNAADLFDDGYSWVGGNPDGDITLVEFLDYRCGYCRRAHDEVAELLAMDGNIRLIVKEFPILGEQSVLASQFAIATKQIAGDDAYKSLADALMTFSGDMNIRNLRRLAGNFGVDVDAIEAHMDSDAVADEIRATRVLAQRLQISGTPTFVLQDELLRGYLPFDQMLAIVEEKRG
ncbi:MAG: DsbA family protein [Paracoccaceae bacterium]